ncbi:MAG: hypothetical protein ACI87O_000073 [Planctomycetota bacterium]|jgi:hypothetical protein
MDTIRGFYILTEQLDESTLRRAGRMPGDLYSGEMIGMDHFTGVPRDLWYSAGTWRKVAVNNHFDVASMAPLEELIQVIKEASTTGDQSSLARLIDMEAFAKFSAYQAIVGTTHVGNEHNWRLYYDPWKATFEPVVWDPVGWHETARPRAWVPFRSDPIKNDLEVMLHNNGEFLAAKSEAIAQFFAGGADYRTLQLLSESISALEPVVALDPDMVFRGESLGPGRTLHALRSLRSYVDEHFRRLQIAYWGSPTKLEFTSNGNRLRIDFSGIRHLNDLRIELSKPWVNPIAGTLGWNVQGGRQTRDLSGLFTAISPNTIELSVPLVADIRVRQNSGKAWLTAMGGLEIGPGYFEFDLEGLPAGAEVTAISASHGNAEVNGWRVEDLEVPEPMQSMFDRVPRLRHTQPLVWSGEVRLVGVNVLEQDLILKPGTQLHMEPGASLIVRGKVLAEGTAEEPILVRKAGGDPLAGPWGTLAIVGKHADGSRFSHCEFSGGSGLIRPLYEFSGMVSAHGVTGVSFRHCSFADNEIVDDMVHAVYCNISFENCTWENSRADALDLDISEARIENCQFTNSGDDSIDLMTTQATIAMVLMEGSGDKGVSVGEGSEALLTQCVFRDCEIGVQAKDASLVVIVSSRIVNCALGVDAYKKNWRYSSGGFVYLLHSSVAGGGVLLRSDSVSLLRLTNCFVAGGLDQDFVAKIEFVESDGLEQEREIKPVPNFRGDAFIDPWGKTYSAAWPDWLSHEYLGRTSSPIPGMTKTSGSQ